MQPFRLCCKFSDEATFCVIEKPYISKNRLTRHILFHPLPGGFRNQDKRQPIMYINEAFISCGRNNQKPFSLMIYNKI